MLLILLVVLAITILFGISIYNKLMVLKNKCENAWSDIDVQLRRRYDLIPNLVETVKGYAGHEKDTLEKVIKARQGAINAGSTKDQGMMENMLTGALGKLFALAESYPDLKANISFQELQNSLKEIETDLQNARRYYNAVVRDLNTQTELFPSNIIANGFSIKKREYFELGDDEAKEPVNVKFD